MSILLSFIVILYINKIIYYILNKLTLLFIFKTTKEELNNIWEEVVEHPKELIPQVRKLVYDKPYQYLFINVDTQRLFRGFDEIILDEENESENEEQC